MTILRRRCPECGRGAIFRAPFSMNETCPNCGIDFDRGQPGYFTGAMYISYALGIPLIASFTLLWYLVFPEWRLWQLVMFSWVCCLPLTPWIWQYSRTIFMHFDRWADPDEPPDPAP
jgi:uncharacterized protein (DUF983 family)